MNKSIFLLIILFALFLNLNGQQNQSKITKMRNIITIGDSNGAIPEGWVTQLRTLMPKDRIVNFSVSGNTIGFDNLDRPQLNTLKNIDNYLKSAQDSATSIDYVIFLLGTNDCKACFDKQNDEVSKNLEKLILKVKAYPFKKQPEIVVVSPPPYGPDSVLIAKYAGSPARVKKLIPLFKQVAKKQKCPFIDIYKPLAPVFMNYSKDGVHLSAKGQMIIAKAIANKISK
jgi:lysophospholipase L1-like esterase